MSYYQTNRILLRILVVVVISIGLLIDNAYAETKFVATQFSCGSEYICTAQRVHGKNCADALKRFNSLKNSRDEKLSYGATDKCLGCFHSNKVRFVDVNLATANPAQCPSYPN
jgi:hypothetical protein